MKVSLIIVALNEEKVLPSLFNSIEAQSYDHDNMEIILVDSMSTDKTKSIMLEFKQNSSFKNVKVIENIKKKLAPGWNAAIKASSGEVVMRVDAHADIPSDFVFNSIECIKSGEDVCGGARPNILYEDSDLGRMLLLAESSAFGSSIAPFRNNNEKTYVKSVFHGCYRRDVFKKVGLLNEFIGRTEDNEIHYRIRENGYKICLDPSIVSYQHVRPTFSGMMKQKYSNGYWVALTLGVCPKCISIYHLVPGAFVASLAVGGLLFRFTRLPLLAVLGGYCIANLGISALTLKKIEKENPFRKLLPILFAGIHVSYGVGTIAGLFKLPSFVKEYKRNHRIEKLDY